MLGRYVFIHFRVYGSIIVYTVPCIHSAEYSVYNCTVLTYVCIVVGIL
jgi:hypothetical protein